MTTNPTRRIAITGGPSGGKTTALAQMTTWCIDHGFSPLVVPEAASTLIPAGLPVSSPTFQRAVMKHVRDTEELFMDASRGLPNPVLLCDRGLCDQRAYIDDGEFAGLGAVLFGMSPEQFHVHARDERYDGVIFLHSAAEGVEEFYTTDNNPARYESVEEARETNRRTLRAWTGAPHLSIIDNVRGQSFEQKVLRATQSLARILGIPEPLEIERKYLVDGFNPAMIPENATPVDIVQTYLVSKPGIMERVRARGQGDHWIFYHTIKEPRGPGISVEREHIITRDEYHDALVRRDVTVRQIHKTRYCFPYEGHYCELDVFSGNNDGLVMLEIEVPDREHLVTIPPFLGKSVREVTDDSNYSNYMLAKAA